MQMNLCITSWDGTKKTKEEKEASKYTGSHKCAATLKASASVHHQLKQEQETEESKEVGTYIQLQGGQ